MSVLSRRQILLGGAAAALLASAAVTVPQVGDYPTPRARYKHLTPKTAAILAVIGDFLSPPGGPFPGSAGDAITLARLDAHLDAIPKETRDLLLALPLLFEHGTALDRFGSASLVHLPAETRDAYLRDWAEATDLVRSQLFLALRTLYGLAYFERAEVVLAMGIAPRCGAGA